jgi:hypothetical protein
VIYLCFSELPLSLPPLIDNLLDGLDGAMVTIAMYTINIAHPGILLAVSATKEVNAKLSA